jgi:hypothetical protein
MFAVKCVTLDEKPTQPLRELPTDGALASTGNSGHEDDHRDFAFASIWFSSAHANACDPFSTLCGALIRASNPIASSRFAMQINYAGVPPDQIGQFLVQRREEILRRVRQLPAAVVGIAGDVRQIGLNAAPPPCRLFSQLNAPRPLGNACRAHGGPTTGSGGAHPT